MNIWKFQNGYCWNCKQIRIHLGTRIETSRFCLLCLYPHFNFQVALCKRIRILESGKFCCGIFHCVWNISASAGSINNEDCIFHFFCFISFVHSYITIVLNILLKITILTSFMVTTSKRLDYVCPAQTELGKGSLLFQFQYFAC